MYFADGSAKGQWVRSALRDGLWDAWVRSLGARVSVPVNHVENRILQFAQWGHEFAKDLGVPKFLEREALSVLTPEVWESILHDSASPRIVLARIREELLRMGSGEVGNVPIPRDIWDEVVPASRPMSRSGTCGVFPRHLRRRRSWWGL